MSQLHATPSQWTLMCVFGGMFVAGVVLLRRQLPLLSNARLWGFGFVYIVISWAMDGLLAGDRAWVMNPLLTLGVGMPLFAQLSVEDFALYPMSFTVNMLILFRLRLWLEAKAGRFSWHRLLLAYGAVALAVATALEVPMLLTGVWTRPPHVSWPVFVAKEYMFYAAHIVLCFVLFAETFLPAIQGANKLAVLLLGTWCYALMLLLFWTDIRVDMYFPSMALLLAAGGYLLGDRYRDGKMFAAEAQS